MAFLFIVFNAGFFISIREIFLSSAGKLAIPLVCYSVIACYSKSIRFGFANLSVPSGNISKKYLFLNPSTQNLV